MYAVKIKLSALKELKALPGDVRARAIKAIDGLANEARPAGVRKLVEHENLYRLRIGDYRVLYQIDDATRVIIIFAVRKREDAYRFL